MAVIEQVPAATIITVDPDTVHTAGVVEAKLTGRPELAVAMSVNGAAPAAWTTLSLLRVKAPVTITGLTTGTTYQFQARALVQSKFTDWSDPVTFVCG